MAWMSEIGLSVRAGTQTNDAAGSAIAQLVRVVTSDADAPKLAYFAAAFDPNTDEHLFWQFRLPDNYNGTPTLYVQLYNDTAQGGDANTVAFEAAVVAVTPGDADVLTALDITNDGDGWTGSPIVLTNGTTAGRLYESEIDLADDMDGAAGGDLLFIGLRRDVSDDDAAGDACVVAVSLKYAVGTG